MTKRGPFNFTVAVACLCILFGVIVVAGCPMSENHVMIMPCPYGRYGVWIRPLADWSLLIGWLLVTALLLQPQDSA